MNVYTLLTLCRDNPRRPPDWRWQLANHLADHPDDAVATINADLWVVQALLVLTELRRPSGAKTPPPTTLVAAYDIYAGVDQLRRWMVEGYLLTKRPLEWVAARCGVRRDVIAAYAEVFFHVRDRLEASSYIVHHVIGSKLHVGLTEHDVGVLLKIAGYRGVDEIIDTLVIYFRNPQRGPQDCDEHNPKVFCDCWDKLSAKVWVTIQTLPINGSTVTAAGVFKAILRCLTLPVVGEEVSAEALAARMRLVDAGLNEVRECVAPSRSRP